jgi:hypothetical protein
LAAPLLSHFSIALKFLRAIQTVVAMRKEGGKLGLGKDLYLISELFGKVAVFGSGSRDRGSQIGMSAFGDLFSFQRAVVVWRFRAESGG